MELSIAITRFEVALRANGRAANTVASYITDVGTFAEWLSEEGLGDLPVDAVTGDVLATFVASDVVLLKRDGTAKAAGSVNKVRASLRAFFGWLVDTGTLAASPAVSLRLRRVEPVPPDILTPAEQNLLLKTIRVRKGDAAERDRLIVELLLGTGIRLSSLVALDVEDLQLDEKRMVITAKGGRRERIFLKSELRRLLRGHVRHLARGGCDSGALFRSRLATRISARQVQTRLRYWLDEAGIDKAISPHSLRHTFGSRLYARTHDLRLVQKALGHRHVTTTQLYVQLADDALEQALETL